MEAKVAKLLKLMIEYDRGDAPRVHHLLKVHELAAAIGVLEGLESGVQGVLEAAAVVHDIGIHASECKYGSSSGKWQELEGPAEARLLLQRAGGFTEAEVERICFLVGHHHTYSNIEGADYQILVEADFLVNIYEDGLSEAASEKACGQIFRTRTGRLLWDALYGGEPWKKIMEISKGC